MAKLGNCLQCGREIIKERWTRKFCTNRCNKNYYSQSRRRQVCETNQVAAPHRCKECGAKIVTKKCVECEIAWEKEKRKNLWKLYTKTGQQLASQN